jgi:transposase
MLWPSRHKEMAKAYSNDLRCKLLTAYDRGQGSLCSLAALFSVSYDWAKKISSQRLRSQQMERVAQSRHGAVSRSNANAVEAALLRQLHEQPDRTLAELQQGLQQSLGLCISSQHLWRVLKRLGVRLKKSHSTPSSETLKPIKSDGRSSLRKSTRPRWTS